MDGHSTIRIGVIADDFTGGSDAASFLAESGVGTILYNGVPSQPPRDCGAVVIALKTRSVPADEAVRQTLRAARWLRENRAEKLYFKYCSTFDSTPEGNIGPVLDSLLDFTGAAFTVLCPSLPVNGRTVRNGVLYVDGIPLAESPMKDHPLNPMWASSLSELMRGQSKYPCLGLERRQMEDGAEVSALLERYRADHPHFYVVPDYEDGGDGIRIAGLFGGLPLLSGGSGLLEHLYPGGQAEGRGGGDSRRERSLILCGSCSRATSGQIRHFQVHGGRSCAVDAEKLLSGEQTVAEIWRFVSDHPDETVLVYSDAVEKDPDSRGAGEKLARASALIERTMAELGALAERAGFDRIVVAGGETSGAVMLRLGYDTYYIGRSIAPGVPEMTPIDNARLKIILKSGNFGQEDFFERAVNP